MAPVLFHQIRYAYGSDGLLQQSDSGFRPVSSSLRSSEGLQRWDRLIRPWLLTSEQGSPEPSLFYTVFGWEAVLVRRTQRPNAGNAKAHLLIGPASELTPRLALELRDWTWAEETPFSVAPLISSTQMAEHRSGLRKQARSLEPAEQLTALLSQVLAGPRAVVVPHSPDTLALAWGICDILGVLTSGLPAESGGWTPSFETFDDRPVSLDVPGLFLRFRQGAPELQPDPVNLPIAQELTAAYIQSGVSRLRGLLEARQAFLPTSAEDRVSRLGRAFRSSAAPPPPQPGASMPSPPSAGQRPSSPGPGPQIPCPICLGRLSWAGLPYYTFDKSLNQYVPLELPPGLSDEQRNRMLRTASVRCPNPGDTTRTHYLPAGYGTFGPPAIYGFIGNTTSGKTHLVASMVGAIEQGGLASYGLHAVPMDLDQHQLFLRTMVRPLLVESTRLSPTREGEVAFVDAFVVSDERGGRRPLALFDVAGSELSDVGDAKRFLDIADGLVFVADPARFAEDGLGDAAFNTVLNLLHSSGRLAKVSAAIVLNKADLLKFDDPVAYWLRRDEERLDPADSLAESADVYAYLHQRGAQAWTRPYQECGRATLHVASATGTNTVERGVRPMRVLKPLVSLMAMTGLLPTSEAETIGI